MNVLLVDNYDSFTYNVVHLLRDCGVAACTVRRNADLPAPGALGEFDAVIASPGPGLPADSGQLLAAVGGCLRLGVPYLGICLGHQALAVALGGALRQLAAVQHGVQDDCTPDVPHPLLADLDLDAAGAFPVGRYHSWVVDEAVLPSRFVPLAKTADGVIQVARVADAPAYGLQFHPESIMTAEAGPRLLRNFLALARASSPAADA